MTKYTKNIELIGDKCILRPLVHEHCKGLIESVKDGELWNLWYTLIPKPEEMPQEIERRSALQKNDKMLPFTIFNKADNKIIGTTSYLNIEQANRRVEIGSTWLAKSYQGNGINKEAKLLLLQHAFETLDCNVVEFRTHFCNRQSRKGIESLGAKLDGILRNHMIMPDQTIRDTCVYSIIKTEWPTVKKHLSWLVK